MAQAHNYTLNQTNLTWYDNFKPASFEIASILQYPYLLSAFCEPADAEIATNMASITDTFTAEGGVALIF